MVSFCVQPFRGVSSLKGSLFKLLSGKLDSDFFGVFFRSGFSGILPLKVGLWTCLQLITCHKNFNKVTPLKSNLDTQDKQI